MLTQGQIGTLFERLIIPEKRENIRFPLRYDPSDWCVKDQNHFVIMTIDRQNLVRLYLGIDNLFRYQEIPNLLL